MTEISRRNILMLGAAACMAGAAPAWAQNARQKVNVALDWTINTNHIGLFVAREKGFYAEAGLEVELLPYADTSASTLVSNGVADFGVTGPISLLTQRSAGADLKAVFAIVQTETGRLVFNAGRTDISSPRDLDGKTYGGFGSDWEKALIGTIIRQDGGKGEFETVTLGTSAYEALANGAVDFTLEVYTWEGVRAELDGKHQRAFHYDDYGVPDQHTTLLASSETFLQANPETAARFVQATRRGYAFAVENSDEAASILVDANKGMLTDPAFIRASLSALVDGHYLAREDGTVGAMEPAKMEAIGGFLLASGILRDANGLPLTVRPDFTASYTNQFLD